MNWLRRLLSRDRLERELDAEMRFHFDQAVADAMHGGMTRAEAHRAVRLEWGGVEQLKEECRQARGTEWVKDPLADLRVAWRGVRKSPGFAVAAVSVLALGIGANSAMFSIGNAAFFRPLPYGAATRLVRVWDRPAGSFDSVVALPEIAAWRRAGVLDALIGYQLSHQVELAAPGHFVERTGEVAVTPD